MSTKTKSKSKAKKAAKTSARRKAAGARAERFPENARIRVLAKENPRRPGTTQHKRFEVIKRSSGKTVADFIEKNGDVTALRYAVNHGDAQVVGK